MRKSRVSKFFLLILLLLIGLTIRLFYLGILTGVGLSKEASAQRVSSSEVDKPRGNILDRNLIPFTNRTTKVSMVLKPLSLRGKVNEINDICKILNMDAETIKKEIENKKEPIIFEVNEQQKSLLLGLNTKGVSAVNSLSRYDDNSLAKHVIGYLNGIDKVGEAGIEKYYEDVLKIDSESTVGVITDAKSNLLQGLGYRISKALDGNKILNIKLTLDYHIQKIAETVMNNSQKTGAVVVEDINSGEIVAMVSKPDFSQNTVDKYLNSPKSELFNRAVASYNIGSTFKIIDVALGFEQNFNIDKEYFCSGSVKVGDREFKCASFNSGGHGMVDLTKAFAQSCNPFFINMGISIGVRNIINMADKFGLGHITGIKEQGINEAPGNLPDPNSHFTDGDTANISIGQGEVMATPLQVADVVATVANGGIKNKVNIVDSIVDNEGKVVKDLKVKDWVRIISKDTSDKIKYLMEEVTSSETGTGFAANLKEYGGAGGKTGSAEAGWDSNNIKITHAWFAGYFPKKNPKYSIAVFLENGKKGGEAAAPIFAQIAEEIMGKGY